MALYDKHRMSEKKEESVSLKEKCSFQLLCLMFLALVPILGMVVQNAIHLEETSVRRATSQASSNEIFFTTEIGRVVHNMAVERGTTSLFIGSGGDTTVYQNLLQKYENTDAAIAGLSSWVDVTADTPWHLKSQENFQQYLESHRSDVWFKRNQTTVSKEIKFYTTLNEVFILDMAKTLSRADTSHLWTTVVAYQMIVSAKDFAGIERALGSAFFAQGGFSADQLVWYDEVLAVENARLEGALLYSHSIDEILDKFNGTPLERNISKTRGIIKENQMTIPSVEKGAQWFELMTQYIGVLRQIEVQDSDLVLEIINAELAHDDVELATGYTVLLVVVSIGPLIVIGVYKMASDAHSVAVNLEHVTEKLELEQKKSDQLLYNVFPAIIVDAMKKADSVPAEYFDEVTIMFSDIVGFTERTASISPHNIIDLLNRMYHTFDAVLGRYDVYKVESIAGSYMIGSGLPTKNADKHGEQIAVVALHLLEAARAFHPVHIPYPLELRIGIHTGPCVAGVVGKKRPRYLVFGNTVNIAQSLEQTSEPNRIQISSSTRDLLISSLVSFNIEPRADDVTIKDGVTMSTYWLNEVQKQGNQQSHHPTVKLLVEIKANNN